MKMVKKILLGMVATAAIIGFVGCKANVEDENNMLNVSGDECSIDYENTTDGYSRGFETLKTDHVDGICKITAKVNNNVGNGDGILGYIFNQTVNEDGTYNFTIAGLRFAATKIQCYVSDYKYVSSEYLSKGNDFCDVNGVQVGKAGCLATCTESLNPAISTLKTMTINNGDEVSIWIDVVANDGTSKGRKDAKNTYTVKFYDKDPGRTKDGDELTYDSTVTAISAATATGIALNNPLPEGTAHFSSTKGQSKLGFYANVYANRKLTGNWKIDSTSLYHEAEEIAE